MPRDSDEQAQALAAAASHRVVVRGDRPNLDGRGGSGDIPRNSIGEGGMLAFAMPGCYCAILLGMSALAYHLWSKRCRGFCRRRAGSGHLVRDRARRRLMLPITAPGNVLPRHWHLQGLSPFFAARSSSALRRAAHTRSQLSVGASRASGSALYSTLASARSLNGESTLTGFARR